MNAAKLCSLTLAKASAAVRDRDVSPLELTSACLERINSDRELNTFTQVFVDEALQAAAYLTRELESGNYRGPLHGIPIALKDLIDVAGQPTTAASALFLGNIASEDAAVVRKLRAAGAIILGKNNLHEFAYGGSGYISHFGPSRNPRNPAHITGGSSSGSAAAVAAGFCFAAIGTDTAGSVRLPAACCGVVGHKPTYGLVSTRGVVPLSWSYDHVGPITRTVADAALVLDAIAGYDAACVDSRRWPARQYSDLNAEDSHRLRVGVARKYFFENLDAEVTRGVENALRVLRDLFGPQQEITVPADKDRTVSTSQSYAFHRQFLPEKSALYRPETLRRIRTGEQYSATDYILKFRELQEMRRRAVDLFRDVDIIITPTSPIPPPSFAEIETRPDRLRPLELMMLRNTRPFNVLGLPAISVPCGTTDSGLPIGLQIAAAPGRDDVALAAAAAFEKAVSSGTID